MKNIEAPNAGRIQQSLIHYPHWNRIVRAYKGTAALERHLAENNRKINLAYEYIPENVNHWSTPEEFERNGGGDCEDFAIFKFFNFAVPRFIAVGGLKADNTGHAVLVVYSGEHGDWIVLDSMQNNTPTWQEYLKDFTLAYLCDLDGVYI